LIYGPAMKKMVYGIKHVWIYHDVSSKTMDLYVFVTTYDSEKKKHELSINN
jgi:hypothetical protein